MFYILSLLIGIIIAFMVLCNGGLTTNFGVYSATVIIHVIGLLVILFPLLYKKEHPFSKRCPFYLYLGGVIGVVTTVFNNLAFGKISISAILALGLLGQSITGILIDHFGFLGMPKHPFQKKKLGGLIFVGAGIVFMMTDFHLLAVIVSLLTGVTLVVSRSINAKLGEKTSVISSTFWNYFTGFITAIPVLFILGSNEPLFTNPNFSISPYLYLGGVLGVVIVFFSNMTVQKISAFSMTLFLFVGQVFTGILLDGLLSNGFSATNLIGGGLVTMGLILNLFVDRVHSAHS